jgi:hypothetical protein
MYREPFKDAAERVLRNWALQDLDDERAAYEAEEHAESAHSSCPVEGCVHLDSYEKADLDYDRMAREPSPYESDPPPYWPYSGCGC